MPTKTGTTTIRIKNETKDDLDSELKPKETYDMLLNRLLKEVRQYRRVSG